MEVLVLFVTCALLIIALTTILNVLTFHRLKADAKLTSTPYVSILIPARNEASAIGATIERLLKQDYRSFELILLDDHSTDGTGEIANKAAQGDTRFQIIYGQALPEQWGGKNWACWQLSQAAQGEILLFTDADVQWSNRSLTALMAQMQRSNTDLLTIWSTQQTVTWGERLIVPLMALVIWGYLPVLAVYYLPFSAFAAANGQCMTFRRKAYDLIGGHRAVQAEIVEDIALSRRIKQKGLRLDMADGAGLIMCRMYHNWETVRDGYAKNILAGYGNSFFFLGLATLFHWMIFLFPWLWLLLGWLNPASDYPLVPLLFIALGIGARALSASATKQRLLDALLLPVSVLLMTRIAAQSVYWHLRYGGIRWKDRTIKKTGGLAPHG